ncbi:MAG: signal peptidase I [Actinomycetes bacterium]
MRRELFEDSPENKIWVEGESINPDSKTLFTISSAAGEATVLITPTEIVPSKSRMFVQAPPERVITGNQVWEKRAQGIIKTLGYILSAVLITFSLLSMTGYVKARVVLTDSMAPSIKAGDIVLLDPTTHSVPKIGDVAAYTGRRFDGTEVGIFTHRIIGGDAVNGFIMKGDNNPSPDIQRPKIADVSGVVVFKLPFIGKVLNPKMLFILVPVVFGIWLITDALRDGK